MWLTLSAYHRLIFFCFLFLNQLSLLTVIIILLSCENLTCFISSDNADAMQTLPLYMYAKDEAASLLLHPASLVLTLLSDREL